MKAKTQEYNNIIKKNKIAKTIFYISIAILFTSIISAIAYKNARSIFISIMLISLATLLISKKIKNKTNYIIQQIEIIKTANNELEK